MIVRLKNMLGEEIKKNRQICRMSQKELANRLGKSRQMVSRWETGDATPNESEIEELALIFGVSSDDLCHPKGEEVLSSSKEEKGLMDIHQNIQEASHSILRVKMKFFDDEEERLRKIKQIQQERRSLKITAIVGVILLILLAMYLYHRKFSLGPNGGIEGPAVLDNETGIIVNGTKKPQLGG